MTRLILSDLILKLFSAYDVHFQNLFHTWVAIMIVVAVVCFLVSEISRNYSQVDKLWSLLPIAYGWVTVASAPSARLIIMASLVTVWGLRLSYNFYRKGGYSIIPWQGEEDYRWKILRNNPVLKGRVRFGLFNLLFISFYQNIVILLFSSPLLLSSLYPGRSLTLLDGAAAIMMLVLIITEGTADNQLFKFHQLKKRGITQETLHTESSKNGFLTEGLWKYVRHPNFASEQGIWICFYFFGVAASGKMVNITLLGPFLLVLVFLGSTKLTEIISAGKYPDYSEYQKTVPKFIPGIFNRMKKNETR
jgi:steroid 5-alpha reductase family enzyme